MAGGSFKEFVLDQLTELPELRARSMFGGHGLYQADRFFGIVMEGRLYFKTGDPNRAAYLKHGMGPFTYEKRGRRLTMSYHEVPAAVLENREEIVAWAHQSVRISAAGRRRNSTGKSA